jgi:DNA-binding transcriptional ArsR family regulator
MHALNNEFKETAALVAEPVRATILWTLLDGRAYTATELSIATESSPSNISMHLSKLLKAGLLKVQTQGRHRYYAFSKTEVAHAIESLAALIPMISGKKKLIMTDEVPGIQQCRTCYDHLAGKTGVAITDGMLRKKFIQQAGNSFELTTKGAKWFAGLDIDAEKLKEQRRSFLRPCLDWSERRYHMAGSLAAAMLDKLLADDWMRKTKHSRALIVTGKGEKLLQEAFGSLYK